MRWKTPLFATIAVVGFFTLVELGLWAFGVDTLLAEMDPFHGFSERVRVFEPDRSDGLYRTRRAAVLHSFNPQWFRMEKPTDGFRVFVLGGSSAYGFPWGAGASFSAHLETSLRDAFPGRTVEVVNAAAMSYGSHRIRVLVREMLEYQPDALVIYEGHNEFVERRFYRDVLERPEALDRTALLLYRSRLFSVMSRAYRKLAANGSSREAQETRGGAELLGLDVSREHSVDVSAEEKAEAHLRFEENLRDILKRARAAGVPVYLCTVPSNIRGWRPYQSLFPAALTPEARRLALEDLEAAKELLASGDAARAAERLERARSSAPGHAEIEFVLGTAYDRLGRFEDALEAYERARDDDASPTRADREMNERIRRAAEMPGVVLVDAEREFRAIAEDGIVGFDLIQDYVHPNRRGHAQIARLLWKAIVESGALGSPRSSSDEAFWAAVEPDLRERPAEEEAKSPALVYNLAVILENQGEIERAMETYRESRTLGSSHVVEASASVGRLLLLRDRPEEAAAEFGMALAADPDHVKSLLGFGECARRLGKLEEAESAVSRATRVDPGSAYAWNRLGVIRSERGRFSESEEAFQRAVSLEPRNAGYRTDLGFVLLFQAKIDAAEAAFRESLRFDAADRRAWNGLAAVLVEQGKLAEGKRIFEESLRIDPSDRRAIGGLEIVERRAKH